LSYQWVLGAVLALAIAGAAYQAKSLSREGRLAAIVIGTLTFGGGGLFGAAAMVTFFVSASALSRIGGERQKLVSTAFSKGGRRDHGQVLANGLAAAVFAVLFGLNSAPAWAAATAGALAAANADTWATELGVLARKAPRLITSWKIVPPGTSGGVTALGTLASMLGAGLIALITLPFLQDWKMVLAVMTAGVAASLFDSLLGALVQAMYWCPACGKITERHPFHTCGERTELHHGHAWLTNDIVNFSATVLGAAAAVLLYQIL
jgi:uncharacterized protein (TIGR00297 family)